MPKKKETRGGWNKKYKTEKQAKQAQETSKLKWKKAHLKHYQFQVNTESDKDIVEFLDTIENKSAFIKSLIREKMKG